jgi:Tol biopolymer transport system component
LAAVAVIGAMTSPPNSMAQTDTTKIRVVVADRDNPEGDIHLVNADGTLGKNLTHTPEGRGSWIPSFSPDCRRIAFASNRDDGGGAAIYVMDADGSNIRQLTKRGARDWDYMPIFSPDGNRILYIATVDKKRTIWMMNADGSNQRRFTDTPGENWYSVENAWSPDGTKFVFHSTWETGATVRYQPEVQLGGTDLFLADPDGSNVRRLTRVRDTTEWNWSAVWTPDGREIVFESVRKGKGEARIVNADGSNQRPSKHAVPVAWSPDGTQAVFNSSRDVEGKNPWIFQDVYVMDTNGENVRRLTMTTDGGGWSRAVRWSTEGIEFFSSPDGSFEKVNMFVMDPDGTNVRPFGPGGHDAVCPLTDWRHPASPRSERGAQTGSAFPVSSSPPGKRKSK